MKNCFRYILYAAFASVLLLFQSCKRDPGVIDDKVMAKIYAEMLMTDQWINTTPNVRMIADTSLVYEPILEKYGYTVEDYRYSVNYYIDHNDEFVEIMKQTVKLLDQRKAELEIEKQKAERTQKREELRKRISERSTIDDALLYVDDYPNDAYRYGDSLDVQWDTLLYCFTISRIPRVIPDSLNLSSSSMSIGDKVLSGQPVNMDKLQTIKDTAETAARFNGMKPVVRSADFDKKKIRQVKDAYLMR